MKKETKIKIMKVLKDTRVKMVLVFIGISAVMISIACINSTPKEIREAVKRVNYVCEAKYKDYVDCGCLSDCITKTITIDDIKYAPYAPIDVMNKKTTKCIVACEK